jgi:hypothetical protein
LRKRKRKKKQNLLENNFNYCPGMVKLLWYPINYLVLLYLYGTIDAMSNTCDDNTIMLKEAINKCD